MKAVAGVFVLAMVVRLLCLNLLGDSPALAFLTGDGEVYDRWGRQIAQGDWLGKGVFYQAPLYPYFIALVYSVFNASVGALRLTQVVMGSTACVVLLLATRRFFGTPRAGVIAGVLLAIYAPAVFSDMIVQKSSLDVFLTCTLLAFASHLNTAPHAKRRAAWSFAAGLTLACLSLTRENALVLIPVLVAWAWLAEPFPLPGDAAPTPRVRRDRAFAAAAVVVGVCVGLAPAAIRNYAVGGEFHVTTSQLGPNLFIGNNPHAAGSYMPLLPGRGTVATERTDAIELAQQEVGHALTPGEVSRFWVGKVLRFIHDDPAAWLKLMGRKTLLLFNWVELADTEDLYTFMQFAWPLRIPFNFTCVAVLAGAACVLLGRSMRRAWVILAVAGVYAASVVVFYVVARYRLPLAPVLMMLPGSAFDQLCTKVAWVSRGRLWLSLIVSLAIWGLGVVPVASYSEERSNGAFNLGYALLTRGNDPAAAMPYLREAVEGLPEFVEAHKYLGDALMAGGKPTDHAEAIEHYRKAVRLAPDYAAAWASLGRAHMMNGRPDLATEALLESAKLSSGDVAARMDLARALMAARREADAAAALRAMVRDFPDEPSVLVTAAWALATSADDAVRAPAEALALVDQAIARAGGDVFTLHVRGLALAALGRFDDAVAAVREARRIAESQQANPALLAELRQREDDYAKHQAFRRP